MPPDHLPTAGPQLPDDFERQLQHALARVDAPAGLAGRILARAGAPAPLSSPTPAHPQPPASRVRLILSRASAPAHLPRALWAGALAASLAVAVAGGLHVRERALETRRQQLTAQYETAWRVTNAVTARALAETRRSVDQDLARSLERQGLQLGPTHPSTAQPD